MILAILQARFSSTRLPGKVLKKILGKPMLSLQLERVMCASKIDKLIVATSTDSSDNEIENLCKEMQMPCFRGSLNDVLDRFYKASIQYKPLHVVRLTGDCPLIDPQIIDEMIDFYLNGEFDYATNSIEPYTFPDGLDVEIFKFNVLETTLKEAILPSHHEHVTSFIRQNPERFKIGRYESQIDLSRLRWTVDNAEDFDLVRQIYEALYKQNPKFTTQDVLVFLRKNPSLLRINSHIVRNEGSIKSWEKDKLIWGKDE